MKELTRRDVMKLAAIGGLGAMMGRDAQAKAPGVLGVQLYTVRKQIDTDPEATLKAIADIGYKEVEVLRGTLAKVAPAARKVGLSPISVHVETPLITGNWDAWKFMRGAVPESYDMAALINDAKAHGVKYPGAAVPDGRRTRRRPRVLHEAGGPPQRRRRAGDQGGARVLLSQPRLRVRAAG